MKEAKELIEKYERGVCTPDEIKLLQKWFHHLGEDEHSVLSEQELRAAMHSFGSNAQQHINAERNRSRWLRIAAAASILLASCVGLFFYLIPQNAGPELALHTDHLNDVAPGTNKAIITLPNGQSFHLTDTDHGSIAREAGLLISRTADGELVYEIIDQSELNKSEGRYSTIETPRGAQHQVLLPDGTRIWLNAASSIKFPTTFSTQHERIVELTGEAYFEVAKDETRPFIVKSQGQEVKVLGTSFNINGYNDEGITRTTLLEGSVQIRSTHQTGKTGNHVILVPGEQALLTETGFRVHQVGTQQAIDWKNGDFIFQQETLTQILNRVGRWYDVDIVYDPRVDRVQTFSGQVSRSKHLSEVLMILEATGEVQFAINEKRVVASK